MINIANFETLYYSTLKYPPNYRYLMYVLHFSFNFRKFYIHKLQVICLLHTEK